MTITFLRWTDACTEESADSNPVEPQLAELMEIGFLLGENDQIVTIGMEMEEDNRPARWRLHVPKSLIIERRDVLLESFLKKGRKKK